MVPSMANIQCCYLPELAASDRETPSADLFSYEPEARVCTLRLREPVPAGRTFALSFGICENPFCGCAILGMGCVPAVENGGPAPTPGQPIEFSLDFNKHSLAAGACPPAQNARDLANALLAQMTPADWRFLAWVFGICRENRLSEDVVAACADTMPEQILDGFGSDPARTVPFDCVFPGVNPFRFRHQGTEWVVLDQYCCNPDCTCHDVRLDFYNTAEGLTGGPEPRQAAFGLWLDHDTGRGDSRRDAVAHGAALTAAQMAAMLDQLRLAYAGLDRRLARRHALIRHAFRCRLDMGGAPAAPERRAAPKVGRNDPCPCGSGRKYKKCCLGRQEAGGPFGGAVAAPQAPTARPAAAPSAPVQQKERRHPSAADAPQGFAETMSNLLARPNPEKMAALTTAQILDRLAGMGVTITEASFRELAQSRWSASSFSDEWLEQSSLPSSAVEADFMWLAACELWKRFCPERPSMETLDDWMQEGYDFLEEDVRQECRAADIWLRVWDVLRQRFTAEMRTCDRAASVFKGTQLLFNWIQDLQDALRNAALRNRAYAVRGIRFTRETLEQFLEEDELLRLNFRCSLGELFFLNGQPAEGEAVYQQLMREFPHDAAGYVGLAEALGSPESPEADRRRAVALLEAALAKPVHNPQDWSLEERLADMRKLLGMPSGD